MKRFRPNVAAVILSSKYPNEYKVMIAKRVDMDEVWQFPQGGIDKGESPKTALLRELEEEIGTNEVEILSEHPEWLSYEFPARIAKKMYPYDGQTQKYFLVKLNKNANINLKTKHPEFDRYQFTSIQEALSLVNHFKKPVYEVVIEYFKKEGYIQC